MAGHAILFENLPKLKATPPSKRRAAIVMLIVSCVFLIFAAFAAARGLPGHIIETPRAFIAA